MLLRLDKFLKNSRLIKRRTLAKKIADEGRVKINGNVAKAATSVTVGDQVEIQFGQNIVTVEVLDVQEIVRKNDASSLYKLISEKRLNK